MRSTLTSGDGPQTQQWLSNQAKCVIYYTNAEKTIRQHS
jgi:hypothetical protein